MKIGQYSAKIWTRV